MEDFEALLARIMALGAGRRLIAVAGPPAAGKSHLAARLVAALPDAALVPMDGFHLDNQILDASGLRAVKGAPETFDAAGFLALIGRIKAGGAVVYPEFDRDLDLAIAGRGQVRAETRLVVVEGNYLLLDEAPWCGLADLWDLTIAIEAGEALLRRRLEARWRDQGCDAAGISDHLRNDLANAARVMAGSRPAGVTVTFSDETP